MKALKNKSKGNEVKILQLYLNVTCDGKFGPKTEAAVNGWKNENGMNPDGIFSETDWGILVATLPTIQQGIKSKFVKMWQLFLGVTADGVFGSKTAATTKTYQASAGLTIDGVVGRQTWLMAFTGKTENPVSTAPQQTTTTNKKPIDYKQYDSRWGYIKYSTHTAAQTIRNSGCGPSSAADIVATWWDNSITPKELCALAVQKGYRTYNSGTAWDFFRYIADVYGASKFIQTTAYATAEAAIKDGAYVVCSMKPGLWTKGGHFICWWKVDNTYVYINDPASSSSARAKAKKELLRDQCKQYFIFYK